jgi:fatty acid desaturase
MTTKSPWRIGVTMTLTAAIAYTVCTLAYALMPEQGIEFLNALFHGLDFRKLGVPAPLTLVMFVYPLVVLVVWGFAVGTLFGWLHKGLHGGRARD